VTAPDLLGHGLSPASTDYTIKAFVDALLPLLSATGPYDLVIGASLGAIVALAILPHLSGSLHVILVDPPLEMSKDALEVIRLMATEEVTVARTVDQDIKERNYAKEDAIWRAAGRGLCKASTVESILQVTRLFVDLVEVNSLVLHSVCLLTSKICLGRRLTVSQARRPPRQ
jgi:pimeloyl-ACP methyl ester carboxylesterase